MASTCKGPWGSGGRGATWWPFLAGEVGVPTSCGSPGTRMAARRQSESFSCAHFYPHLLILFFRKQILSFVPTLNSGARKRPMSEYLSSFQMCFFSQELRMKLCCIKRGVADDGMQEIKASFVFCDSSFVFRVCHSPKVAEN